MCLLNGLYPVSGGVQISTEGRGTAFSKCTMPENAALRGRMDEVELGFVEREATPRLLMKFSIQMYLAGLSLEHC